MVDVHWWLRQVNLHACFHRLWAAHKTASAGAVRPDTAMAQLFAAAGVAFAGENMTVEGVDAIKKRASSGKVILLG